MFVEVVARDDHRVTESRVIEKPAGLDAQVSQIARIQAHADHLVAAPAQPQADLNGFANALDRVVCVDEEHAVVRHRGGVRLERFGFVLERHDPTVRVRASDWDPEYLAGQYVRGRGAATDICRAAGGQRSVEAVGVPQAELENRISACCCADA